MNKKRLIILLFNIHKTEMSVNNFFLDDINDFFLNILKMKYESILYKQNSIIIKIVRLYIVR